MYKYFDLHRHDNASQDGNGTVEDCVERAAALGYGVLGISNHGCIDNLQEHARACTECGIKPIFGCEIYLKGYHDSKPSHLCLFCKNKHGYDNLCKMFDESVPINNKPVITFDVLAKYSDDLICTTACLSSEISREILAGKIGSAVKLLYKFRKIFRDDLYIEIIPYTNDNHNTQLRVNLRLIELATQFNIKCIITSDSHTCYLHDEKRVMPSECYIRKQFTTMFYNKFDDVYAMYNSMIENLSHLSDTVYIFDV